MKNLIRGVAVVSSLTVATALFWRVHLLRTAPPRDMGDVAPFTLTDRNGQPFSRDDLKGKVWIADFIFTRCPGPCPMMSRRMETLQKALADRPDIQFVSFSVDPDFDTPAVLDDYARRYRAGPRWHFLTGSKDTIFPLINDSFHLGAAPGSVDSDGQMNVMHSIRFVLVGRNANIIAYYDTNDPGALDKLKAAARAA